MAFTRLKRAAKNKRGRHKRQRTVGKEGNTPDKKQDDRMVFWRKEIDVLSVEFLIFLLTNLNKMEENTVDLINNFRIE